jgi:hypothetical protein
MVLVADNAPYHHKREIGSLASLTKSKLIDMMEEHEVDFIDIPATDVRYNAFLNGDCEKTVRHGGEIFSVDFEAEAMKGRASRANPWILNVQELKITIVNWLKENNPELLECKIEKFLKDRGHEILWTPPYCPDLQPIELFWAAGKNHCAYWHLSERSIKETVSQNPIPKELETNKLLISIKCT